jgi:hypothetical protein
MVRRDINDNVHSNANTNRGNCSAAGLPILRIEALSAEREVCLDARCIRFVDECCFAQPAFAFGAFRRQQMASRSTRSQNLTSRGNLEALRH